MKPHQWSERRINEMEAEGRGKGTGPRYRPWLEVTNLSSRGNSRRVFSHKTGRIHHLLSDGEWGMFLLLEFDPEVTDIREQFPLPRTVTQSLAAERRIKHPIYPGTDVPAVMTCDFLATRLHAGKPRLEVFDCKRATECEEVRSLEKLEIHRSWCDGVGIPHHLVIHERLPKTKIRNLEWIRSAQLGENEIDARDSDLDLHCQRFSYDIARTTQPVALNTFCENYDIRTGAPMGTGLRVARLLLIRRALITDLNQPDLAAAPLSLFRLTNALPNLRVVGGS